MNLNKKICMGCINGNCSLSQKKWSGEDDDRWEKGKVWCRKIRAVENCNVTLVEEHRIDIIPENCPYKLEHMVTGQEIKPERAYQPRLGF